MSQQPAGRTRPQQVIEALYAANEGLPAAQRQARFARMAASPERFFRIASTLYWQDAWHDWRVALFGGWPETRTWLHGDAQVGAFAAVCHPHEPLHYGLAGVDSALIGDYQLDLWRLATSLVLDGRENAGLSAKAIDKALEALVAGYMGMLAAHCDGRTEAPRVSEPLKGFLTRMADRQRPRRALEKWTEQPDGQKRRFLVRPGKLANLPADVASQLKRLIDNDYQQTLQAPPGKGRDGLFAVKDSARRLSAAGVEHYFVLLEGGPDGEHDDVILEVKEQVPPAAFALLTKADQQGWRKLFPNEGLRHAAAFHALGAHNDVYLGWLTLNDRVFAVRRLPEHRKALATRKLGAKAYRKLARQWGQRLAWQHLQGAGALNRGDARGFSAAVCRRLEGDEASFTQGVTRFAHEYATCVEQDYALFLAHFMAEAA